ncbi:MAG: hypothetical protein A4E42_02264 [Methanoregulaceae archaeon PtaU1.Bin222]|nr:MAG: hypothetical protein A4E42_02264 [Methanoregulaceae archaeon PtaU1.Bin222]
MNMNSGLKVGALLLALTAILIFAGCTQPATTTNPTPHPTATTPVSSTAVPTVAVDNQTLKTELALYAGAFAEGIDGNALATALREGPNSTAFATVLDDLRAFKEADPRIKYVYTLEQRNGRVFFIVDANYGLPDGSNYMDEYKDAPLELSTPVTAPIGVGPYTDQWGTFYSGYAPVSTTPGGPAILMGVDIKA